MKIYCCGCNQEVTARLTDGAEIYPHRSDLHCLPFWKCDRCGNYVGCHHKTENRTRPLGCIPTEEIRKARKEIHKVLDPIWRSGCVDRKALYAAISEHLGWTFHTAKIRSTEEARKVCSFISKYA
jgi:hypothetical protein